MKPLPQIAHTHSGKFHADDVFSTALLQLLQPGITVRRVARLPEDFAGFAYDLGGGAFDHHQKSAPTRENGVPYAAFGLLWREYGATLLDEKEADAFDRHFVQPLDRDDNTGCGDPIAEVIANFNPAWDTAAPETDCFDRAVAFARVILENRFAAVAATRRAHELVRDALAAAVDGVVVLPRYAPWKYALYKTHAQFVIYPSQRGGYNAQAVPLDDADPPALKHPFPAAWAGLSETDLPVVSGIPTLRFCHPSRFLIAAGTLADASAACAAAL